MINSREMNVFPSNTFSLILFLGVLSIPISSRSSHEQDNLSQVLIKSKQGVFSADFEDKNGTRINVRDGETASMDCRVFLKQDKTISWLRHTQQSESTSHLELLTVGLTTWTGDERIKADFKYPNNWRLNISDITKPDKGLYICQISTHPVKTLHVILNVRDALVEMVEDGSEEGDSGVRHKYYNPGSDIRLDCVVRARMETITPVTWWKDGILLDLQQRDSVSIATHVESSQITSKLLIKSALVSDAGNYSCSLPNFNENHFPRAKTRVHVIFGDHAAVYGGAEKILHFRNWKEFICQITIVWSILSRSKANI